MEVLCLSSSLQFHYFAAYYDVGLVSHRVLIPEEIWGRSTLDRDFDILAASVDGIGVLPGTEQMEECDNSLYVE